MGLVVLVAGCGDGRSSDGLCEVLTTKPPPASDSVEVYQSRDVRVGTTGIPGYEDYINSSFQGRDHMGRSRSGFRYHVSGELPIVFDVGYATEGFGEGEVFLLVLIDGRPVPFDLVVSPSGDPNEFDGVPVGRRDVLVVRESEPVVFSIALEASVIESDGWHDFRLLMLPVQRDTIAVLPTVAHTSIYASGRGGLEQAPLEVQSAASESFVPTSADALLGVRASLEDDRLTWSAMGACAGDAGPVGVTVLQGGELLGFSYVLAPPNPFRVDIPRGRDDVDFVSGSVPASSSDLLLVLVMESMSTGLGATFLGKTRVRMLFPPDDDEAGDESP